MAAGTPGFVEPVARPIRPASRRSTMATRSYAMRDLSLAASKKISGCGHPAGPAAPASASCVRLSSGLVRASLYAAAETGREVEHGIDRPRRDRIPGHLRQRVLIGGRHHGTARPEPPSAPQSSRDGHTSSAKASCPSRRWSAAAALRAGPPPPRTRILVGCSRMNWATCRKLIPSNGYSNSGSTAIVNIVRRSRS